MKTMQKNEVCDVRHIAISYRECNFTVPVIVNPVEVQPVYWWNYKTANENTKKGAAL